MNAYELAGRLLEKKLYLILEGVNSSYLEDAANMLRQQADRIGVLEANYEIQKNINDKALQYITELEKDLHMTERHYERLHTQTKPLSAVDLGDYEYQLDRAKLFKEMNHIKETKPLSNDEILEMTIWNKNLYELYVEMEKEDMIAFARAIEERHGIK